MDMVVSDVVKGLDAVVLSGKSCVDREIGGVYICDLLSWVMSNAQSGDIWITVNNNINIVVISSILEISCIIIPEGIIIDQTILEKADEKDVIILSSNDNSYNIAKKLGTILVNKSKR
jgi:predicted transcriptional regulator